MGTHQCRSLRRFPETGRDLVRFFTLPLADVAFVDPGRGRGPADRLGPAVYLTFTLCTLPCLGFVQRRACLLGRSNSTRARSPHSDRPGPACGFGNPPARGPRGCYR